MPTVSAACIRSCSSAVRLPVPQPEVDHPPAGNRDAECDQIVEGLPPFGEESLVLIRVPPLNRSHGHRIYV